MRVYQEITERIRYVEGFEVLVSGGATPRYPSDEYRFARAASHKTVVSEWLATRFRSAYPTYTATVIRPDGEALGNDVPIGLARDAYHDLNRRSCSFPCYGQSLSYEYSDDVEKTVLELRRTLLGAHLDAEFDRSKFLWMETFFVRGKIPSIHLPVFQHRELLAILESLAKPLKLTFCHTIGHESVNLFEARSGHEYFGTQEFERLTPAPLSPLSTARLR